MKHLTTISPKNGDVGKIKLKSYRTPKPHIRIMIHQGDDDLLIQAQLSPKEAYDLMKGLQFGMAALKSRQ